MCIFLLFGIALKLTGHPAEARGDPSCRQDYNIAGYNPKYFGISVF
jgi:hypothetical protein